MPDFFAEERYDCTSRIADIQNEEDEDGMELLYHKILEVISRKEILQYNADKVNRTVKVLPYVLEYNIMQHILEPSSDPFSIMCYDLDQKRDVIVKCNDLPIMETYVGTDEPMVEHISQRDYQFTPLEKIYHLLAYAVRCAMESDANEIPLKEYLDKIFKKDDRNGISNYERRVKKYANKSNEELEIAIQNAKEVLEKKLKMDILISNETLNNIFGYYRNYMDEMSISSNEKKYYLVLQYLIYKAINDMIEQEIRVEDLYFSDETIWELIAGTDIAIKEKENKKDNIYIPNEITYYDETIKCEKIAFQLNKDIENSEQFKDAINQIFELFSDYVCRGIYNDLTKRCEFVVDYERYNYRDIHMRIMALSDKIDFDSIAPEKECQILTQRYKNYFMKKEDKCQK